MKKIVIVVTTMMERQGMTSVVLNLLKNMDRTDLSISLLSSLSAEEWFFDELRNLGVAFVPLKSKRMRNPLAYIRELCAYLRQNRSDVLHVHGNSGTMCLEIIAAKWAGVPIRIAHSHNSSCLSKAVHSILKPLMLRYMTLGLACSDLSRQFAFSNKKSIVLNNGIDTEAFKYDEELRQEYRKSFGQQETFIVGHIGFMIPVKNHMFMCRIAKKLKERGDQGISFFLVGEGKERAAVEKYLNDNGLNDWVQLLGSRSDVAALYQMFDLFIMPSLYEGFPMVLVEAQSSGLPCLISDKVTKTTDLIGKAKYLPIDTDEAVQLWADAIEAAMKEKNIDRSTGKQKVEAAGYSALKSAELLKNIYLDKKEKR